MYATMMRAHIAGSKDKGSVAVKTASALSKRFKTDLFVSPHISSFFGNTSKTMDISRIRRADGASSKQT
jgi:folylpolyglutamate synthase/dihydropteroate synthase